LETAHESVVVLVVVVVVEEVGGLDIYRN